MSQAHRLQERLPDTPNWEAITLYGGLFVVIVVGYGLTAQIFLGEFSDPLLMLFGGVIFGTPGAIFAAAYVRIHRHLYSTSAA